MSKNANKYIKSTKSKHNEPCEQRPDKKRYRDTKEAQSALTSHRFKRQQDLAASGTSTHRQDRYYACSGCNGYHLTAQPLGRVSTKTSSVEVLVSNDFILGA